MRMFLQLSNLGIDFIRDFDYNSIRFIFGRTDQMDKLITRDQIEKCSAEDTANTIANVAKNCKGIVKARELTKQQISDNYTALIKDINIPNDIRTSLINMRNNYHIRQDILVFCGICSFTMLAAYAIKCYYDYSLKKERDIYVK